MTERNTIIKVKILRTPEEIGEEARYEVYEVSLESGMSVLDVLDYVYENIDSSLAYYSHTACRRGLCGRCTLKINGKASLACQTPVSEDITIEPLSKLKIVRDLLYATTK